MLKNHLIQELDSALDLNLARLKCLSLLLNSLLRHRTVNLTILATGNHAGATNASCYRRFQNFFLHCPLCLGSVGKFILAKIPKPVQGWILAMDRTNWKFGKRHINILTVGVVVNKVSIPIAWKVLPQKTKRGNSNAAQRIALFARVLKLIEARDILVLAMDREFGSRQWLLWLEKKRVGYVVRIKGNIIVAGKPASKHRATRAGKAKSKAGLKNIWGMELFFATKTIGGKGRRESRLHIVSNRFEGRQALELYRRRWGIEQLFSHLKKRGFDLEATHIRDAGKLEKLFALVSLAFLFSYGWGCQLRAEGDQPKAMARKSIFRQGLEDILRILGNAHHQPQEQMRFIKWLRSPVYSEIFVV